MIDVLLTNQSTLALYMPNKIVTENIVMLVLYKTM